MTLARLLDTNKLELISKGQFAEQADRRQWYPRIGQPGPIASNRSAETAREGLFRGPDPKCSALERPLIQRQGPEWGTWALSLT